MKAPLQPFKVQKMTIYTQSILNAYPYFWILWWKVLEERDVFGWLPCTLGEIELFLLVILCHDFGFPYILHNFLTSSVFLIVLNQEAPLFRPKSAKRRPKIFLKKTPQFDNFLVQKWPLLVIFIAFLCNKFSQKNSKLQKKFHYHYYSKIIPQSGWKSARPRKF